MDAVSARNFIIRIWVNLGNPVSISFFNTGHFRHRRTFEIESSSFESEFFAPFHNHHRKFSTHHECDPFGLDGEVIGIADVDSDYLSTARVAFRAITGETGTF